MKLNLNKPFSHQDVQRLIASKDDTQNRQLRVSNDGMAYLSDVVGSLDLEDVAFCFETWSFDCGYCGPTAAKDSSWTQAIHKALSVNWPNPSCRYIDDY